MHLDNVCFKKYVKMYVSCEFLKILISHKLILAFRLPTVRISLKKLKNFLEICVTSRSHYSAGPFIGPPGANTMQ